MHVPQSAKVHVVEVLRDCIRLIKEKRGVDIPMPQVRYDLRGTTAGTAHKTKGINLNAVLMMENLGTFDNTIRHEFAHMADYVLHPENHRIYDRFGNRIKRDIHGHDWAGIMIDIGANPRRTHQYNTTNSRSRQTRRTVPVRCVACSTVINVTPKVAGSLSGRYHRGCGRSGRLVLQDQQQEIAPVVKPTTIITKHPNVKPLSWTKGKTKMEICTQLYINRNTLSTRAEMLDMFVTVAGCTKAGASTYYSTIQKHYP